MNQSSDSATARAVIYIDLDDEVTAVCERVRAARSTQIALVVPMRAQILQSLVSLKILRHKAAAAGKLVTIVTKDIAGRQLAVEAGFSAAEKVKVTGKVVEMENLSAPAAAREKLGRKELKIAVTNSDRQPVKIDPAEIPLANLDFRARLKNLWQYLAGGLEPDAVDASRLVVRAPSRGVLGGFVIVSLVLLFFIIYIAVPTATIYITPRADPIEKVVNATLLEQVSSGPTQQGNSHLVPAEFFTIDFVRDMRVGATGEIFEGSSATGRITIYNRSPKDKSIVPSRFLSKRDNLVFYTKKALTIPKQVGSTPGSVLAEVVACERTDTQCDCINAAETCQGSFVGEKGNIDPAYFIMPAIPSLSPTHYWAESKEKFTGGVTKITRYITEADIEHARETVTLELTRLAEEELTRAISQKNELEGKGLQLLKDRKTIKVEITNLTIPSDLVGKQQDSFTVAVQARVSGVAYVQDELRSLLYDQLATKVHPEKTLTKVGFDSIATRVEEIEPDSIKLAITVTGLEEYDISELSGVGSRFVSKIRDRILGKSVLEAEKYIRNLPEVNSAAISSWPFWARSLPELPENIKFKIKR